ncbi:MAG: GWxTD domain-containing protein [Bacteroidota bacterium]
MNRLLLTLCCVVALGCNVFGQTGKLKAYIDQKTYYSPETGNYAEVQIQFVGYTLKYEPVEGGLRAKVAIDIAAVNAANDTLAANAYVLESPVMRDSIIEDFFDIVRFPLAPGKYTVHVSLLDLVGTAGEMKGEIEMQIPTYANTVSVSDILIAEFANKTVEPTVFSKSGYDIIPRISNFYPTDLTSLPYYTELYNTDMFPDSLFAVRQRIVSTTDSKEMVEFTRYTKMTAAPVIPLFRNVDISKLPSGSYRLELAIMDRSNTEQGEAAYYYFERINEFEVLTNIDDIVLNPDFQALVTDDSVEYYMASLIPIARPAEVKNILENIKSGNKENCRKHLQQFWIQTSGNNAFNAWVDYKKQVTMVEKQYGNNFQDGYETDRGRVYLQYGPPNNIITRETSPSEYPYEIWHYYKIKMYSNKRFVFYNPDLVNKGYRLLHSDMVGEQQNYRWPQALAKRNSSNINIDNPNDGNNSHYGGNALQDYNLTR